MSGLGFHFVVMWCVVSWKAGALGVSFHVPSAGVTYTRQQRYALAVSMN